MKGRRNAVVSNTCVRCRTSFKSDRPARFCTRQCRDRHNRELKRQERLKQQPPCLSCGKQIAKGRLLKARAYCDKTCSARARARKLALQARERESIPRPCAGPGCDKTVTGRTFIKYCSEYCSNRKYYVGSVDHLRKQSKIYIARKTQENLRTAPPCTICKKTTARSGGNTRKLQTACMTPPHVKLCLGHRKGYACFVSKNKYWTQDPDEVFAAYLVYLVYHNADGNYMRMIREAFHVGSGS